MPRDCPDLSKLPLFLQYDNVIILHTYLVIVQAVIGRFSERVNLPKNNPERENICTG
jgi:hypothetical protein